jgi:hypothetical protein
VDDSKDKVLSVAAPVSDEEQRIRDAFERVRNRRFKVPIRVIVEVPKGQPIHMPGNRMRQQMERAFWEIATIGDVATFTREWGEGKFQPNPPLEVQLITIFAEFLGLIEE